MKKTVFLSKKKSRKAATPTTFRTFSLSCLRTFALSCLLIFCLIFPISAQDLTKGSGREFYLTAFSQCPNPEPVGVPDSVIVYIVGTQACTGYAKNFATGYQLNFSITPNVTTEIRIPATEAQCNDNEGIQHKAIYIETTEDVWVYMQTSSKHCEGTFTTSPTAGYGLSGLVGSSKISIEPVSHFRDELLIYNSINSRADLIFIEAIIATEDNTIITIHAVDNVVPEQTIYLNRGEIYCYEVPTYVIYGQTGCVQTISSNCKPIICFQHWISNLAYGRVNNNYTEVNNYARNFHRECLYFNPVNEISIADFDGMFAKFTLNSNTTEFNINGVPSSQSGGCWGVLHAGYNLPRYFIKANNPFTLLHIEVFIQADNMHRCLFLGGNVVNILWGFLHYPIPTDKMVKETMFVTRIKLSPNSDSLRTELTIVTTNEGRYNTMLNGIVLPANNFYAIAGSTYYYTRLFYENNAPDILHIENSNGFVASLNQFGYYNAPFYGQYATCNVRYLTSLGMCHSGGYSPDMKISTDALDLSPVLCNNDTLRLHVLNNWFNYPISWIIGNHYFPNQESVEFPLVDSGLLTIKLIIDKPNCPDTITKDVYVIIPPIIVDMPRDTAICLGQTIRVHSPNTDRYEWSNGTIGTILTPQYSGYYALTASNYCYSINKNIHVELLDCSNIFYIPNTFTPNGNSLNDIFKPVFSKPEYIEAYKFFIYNRWGNLLYYTTDVYDGWTGYGCEEGVYVYVVEYKNIKEKRKQIKGTVTLLR